MQEAVFNQIHEDMRGLVSTFFAWYTFFWTLNMAVLAWIYAKQDLPLAVRRNRKDIAGLFVVLNVLGTISGLVMLFAVHGYVKSVHDLVSSMKASSNANELLAKLAGSSVVPPSVYGYAFIVSAVSTFLIGCFWLKMYRHERSDTPVPHRKVSV